MSGTEMQGMAEAEGTEGDGGEQPPPCVISLKLYTCVPPNPQMNSNQVLTYEIKHLWLLS